MRGKKAKQIRRLARATCNPKPAMTAVVRAVKPYKGATKTVDRATAKWADGSYRNQLRHLKRFFKKGISLPPTRLENAQ